MLYRHKKTAICGGLLPGTGFEPASLAAPAPQAGASANFATRALVGMIAEWALLAQATWKCRVGAEENGHRRAEIEMSPQAWGSARKKGRQRTAWEYGSSRSC